MLNNGNNGLEIFDNFVIDYKLPKYKKDRLGDSSQEGDNTIGFSNNRFISQTVNVSGVSMRVGEDGQLKPISGSSIFISNDSFFSWVGRKLSNLSRRLINGEIKIEKEPIPEITIEEFFKSIKNSKKELSRLDSRIKSYEAVMDQAKEFGQVALIEKMQRNIDVIRSESQLYALNMITVIEEEQVVDFYKKSEKGIRLDWVKNFSRLIPSKFLEIKKKLDELYVFDNYVIMHYDPESKSFEKTKEEIEKEKDPILFGVMSNSRKLYYIGDWVDEFCDLTLEKLIEEFGEDAINKNNLTSNISVNF